MKFRPIENALIVLANSDAYRKWAGNRGYEDKEFAEYAFDDHVHSWHRVQLGTLLFISRDGFVVGAGIVHGLDVSQGEKRTFACPACQKRELDSRANHRFYCNLCKETFGESDLLVERKLVTKIVASYSESWVPAGVQVSNREFLQYQKTRDTQGAIRELEPSRVESALRALQIKIHSMKIPSS